MSRVVTNSPRMIRAVMEIKVNKVRIRRIALVLAIIELRRERCFISLIIGIAHC